MELIIEQYISLLGSNKDNGKAIGIVGREIWVHPADSFKQEENEPAFKLIDHSIGQAFGYWR
uniref:Putative NAD-P-binding protein n=1 Tax=Moniliophthora roreri TaxID=221103 RepID=A0A0W0F687_MONRR